MKLCDLIEPSVVGKFFHFLVSVGLVREKLEGCFHKPWRKLPLNIPVDVIYSCLKFKLFVRGITIDTKMLFSSRLRKNTDLDVLKNFMPKNGFLSI